MPALTTGAHKYAAIAIQIDLTVTLWDLFFPESSIPLNKGHTEIEVAVSGSGVLQ